MIVRVRPCASKELGARSIMTVLLLLLLLLLLPALALPSGNLVP